MKKVLFIAITVLTLMGAAPRKAHAMGVCTNPFSPDVWFWNYTGDVKRGGVLQYGQGDYAGGTALTSSGVPMPPTGYSSLPTCTYTTQWDQLMGDFLVLNDLTPECNGENYVMSSYQNSYRTMAQQGDVYDDHVWQTGWSWGSNPGDESTPAIISQTEAGSLLGTGVSAAKAGYAHVINYVQGFCRSVAF